MSAAVFSGTGDTGVGVGEVAMHWGLRQLHQRVIVSPSVRMASSSETQCSLRTAGALSAVEDESQGMAQLSERLSGFQEDQGHMGPLNPAL